MVQNLQSLFSLNLVLGCTLIGTVLILVQNKQTLTFTLNHPQDKF